MRTLKGTGNFHPDSIKLDTMSTIDIVELLVMDQYAAVEAVDMCILNVAQLAETVAKRIREGGRLIYVGAGTSGRLAALDAAECIPTFGIPEGVVITIMAGGPGAFMHAKEGAEDNVESARAQMHLLQLTKKDVVCGIAASGTTPFVLAALIEAGTSGAYTILVRNSPLKVVEEVADKIIVLDTGPEVISGSTRLNAGTAQTVFLKTLTTTVFTLLHHTYGGLMVDVKVTNKKLRERAERIVQLLTLLPKAEASKLLDASGNSAKTAVVMHHTQMSPGDANLLLEQHGGRLRDIIGDIDYTKTEL